MKFFNILLIVISFAMILVVLGMIAGYLSPGSETTRETANYDSGGSAGKNANSTATEEKKPAPQTSNKEAKDLLGLPAGVENDDIFERFYDAGGDKMAIKLFDDRDYLCEYASAECVPFDAINKASLETKTVWYAWNSQANRLGGIECQPFEGGCLTQSPATIYNMNDGTYEKFSYPGQAAYTSFSPSAKKFLSFDYDNNLIIQFDLAKNPEIAARIDIDKTIGARKGGRVTAIAWNQEEDKVALAIDSYPSAIYLLDLGKKELKLEFEDDRANFDWNQIDFSADGKKIVFSAGSEYRFSGKKAINLETGAVSTADVEYDLMWSGSGFNAYRQLTASQIDVGGADGSWLVYDSQKPTFKLKYPQSLKPCANTNARYGWVTSFVRKENECGNDTSAMIVAKIENVGGFKNVAEMNGAIKNNVKADKDFLPGLVNHQDIDSAEIIDINGREALKVQQINQFMGEGYWVIYFFSNGELYQILNYKPGMLDTMEIG